MQQLELAPTSAQWRLAVVLCLVNAVAFIDRSALPLLIQPITRDLHVTDTKMSFIVGAAFILTYSIGGLCAGGLTDRFPRRNILFAAVSFWGAATILCGAASNYATLFIGRLGVGAGESACGPACMSMVKDTFAPQYRGRAIAMWAMGAGVGAGSALLGGGFILHFVGDVGTVQFPWLGAVKAWQLVLIACGTIAFPVALLVRFQAEPPRKQTNGTSSRIGVGALAAALRKNWKLFLPLFIANAATIMISTGYSTWMPAFIARTWKLSGAEIGLRLGLIVLFVNTSSQFIAGTMLDIARKRFGVKAIPILGSIACAVVLLPALIIPHAPSPAIMWILLIIFTLPVCGLFTIGTTAVVQLAPDSVVGKLTSIHFAWVGIMGTAIAPTLVAVLSDRVFGGTPSSLGQSLSVAAGSLTVLALLCFLMVWRQMVCAAKSAATTPLKSATQS